MFKKEFLRLIWQNLWRMKMRTLLTILGVLIGTAAIFTMVSLGIGLQRSVTGQFAEVADLQVIEVMPGYEREEGIFIPGGEPDYPLDRHSLEAIRQIPGVAAVTPVLQVRGSSVKIRGKSYSIDLVGMDFTQLPAFLLKLENGQSIRRTPSGALIGNKVLESLEGKGERLKRGAFQIHLTRFLGDKEESTSFRLRSLGVLEERGSTEDYNIIVPLDTAAEMLEWKGQGRDYDREGYDRVQVRAESPRVVNEIQQKIQDMGFMVFSLQQVLKSLNTVFLILQAVLGGIGAIALAVASLGIINTMLMSIYERTKEIGIMKVVGASVADIRNMFIMEAAAIGLLGGLAGIAAGWLFGHLINFAANFYLATVGGGSIELVAFPLWLVFLSLGFALVVGVVAGIYPAMKAARLSPLDAIRQE